MCICSLSERFIERERYVHWTRIKINRDKIYKVKYVKYRRFVFLKTEELLLKNQWIRTINVLRRRINN
jgi:hypothetical protein